MAAAEALFDAIGALACKANDEMAAAVDTIRAGLQNGKLERRRLLTAVLESDQALIGLAAEAGQIDPNALIFIAYGSIKPFVETSAEQLAAYLDPDRPYHTGYCPICGGAPVMATLEEEGRRHFVCGFCWQRWPMRRIFCPFCENTDPKTLDYFFSEAEPDYRVDLCRRCKHYIAAIDLRRADRIVYLPLEQAATLHLDIKAAEEGFLPPAVASPPHEPSC
jgi:FdhE protein